MSSKLNMHDIANLLVGKNDISKEEAYKFLVELFILIEKGLSVDELTKLKDFGTFKLTHIQERESIDVNTKEKIIIPSHRRVSFTPAQLLKSLVNKPFAHFEATVINEGVFIDGISQDSSSIVDGQDIDSLYEDNEENYLEVELTKEDAIANSDSVVTPLSKDTSCVENKESEESFTTVAVVSTSIVENTMELNDNENSLIHSTELEPTNEKATSDIPIKSFSNKLQPKAKNNRRYYLLSGAVIALFIIFAVGFTYNYYFSSNSSKQVVSITENSKQIDDVAIADTENLSGEPKTVVDSVVTVASLPRKTAKMSPGRTLRLIALDKFGNREFWVYIYMVNTDKIQDPNVLPIGQVLELPHTNEYPMNADNNEDVVKAKKLGDKVMKSLSN